VRQKSDIQGFCTASMEETRAVAMGTDRGKPLFSACRECSETRTDALVPQFRDGPLKARHSGLLICPSAADLCRLRELKPRLAGFFLPALRRKDNLNQVAVAPPAISRRNFRSW